MKKILKWTGIILLLLVLLMAVLPFIFKGEIVATIKEEANKNLNAKVDFGDFSLSLFSHFPNLAVSMNNISIINIEPFAGDTLVYAKTFEVTVDIISIISGSDVKIRGIHVNTPTINLLVTKDGINNWSITKSSTDTATADTSKSFFNIRLHRYSINNARILYDDKSMGVIVNLDGLNHSGNGDFTADKCALSTKTDCEKLNVVYTGTKYLTNAHTIIDADIDMDIPNFKFTFNNNKITLNQLELKFDGWFSMPDNNMDMDLKFSAEKSEFKNFISLIPAVYKDGFKDIKSSGKLSLDGFVKGRYNGKSVPGYELNLNIDNGMFQYPSLPASVNNVFVVLKIKNPDGINDHTIVNLSRMHMEIAGDAFDARLFLKTPVSDPDVDASLRGKINLSNMQKIVPLDKGTNFSGIITSDFYAKGKYSTIKDEKYDEFAASGSINVADLKYSSSDLKQPIDIRQINLVFTPQTVALNAFSMKAGKTDIEATGKLGNFIPFALGLQGEKLIGELKMTSTKIDLNEWMSSETQATDKADTAAMNVPGNIDFTLSSSIGTLIYENLTMSSCSGSIIIRDSAVRMKELKMNMLEGTMVMNGSYSTAVPKKPAISFDIDISNFDIQKTSAAFETIQKMAPISKNCIGKFSTQMMVKGMLDDKLNPVLPSLNGGGKLSTTLITIEKFTPLTKLADALKMEKLSKLSVPKTNISFHFADGRVTVDPYDIDMSGFKTTIAGNNGFDQTIEYTMNSQIPRSAFGGAANSVLNGLISSAQNKGANVSVGDLIPVEIKIGGTISNPKISTDLNKQGAKAMADFKAAAAAELAKKKAEAEVKIKAELDKKRADGQKLVDDEKAKLKKQADAKKKEAEDKAKKAAQDAIDKAKKDALNKFNPFKK